MEILCFLHKIRAYHCSSDILCLVAYQMIYCTVARLHMNSAKLTMKTDIRDKC